MLIYAHRGASRDFPEHTREAYLGAVKYKADGFECDVRLSKDGVPVLWHDADEIAVTNYKELCKIHPEIITLDDFLVIAIENKKAVAIETKHPVPTGNAVEDVVFETLKKHNAAAKIHISIMSFSILAVQYIKRKSDYEVVQLVEDRALWSKPLISTPDVFSPSINSIRKKPDLVKKFHKKDKRVFVWTVDFDADMKLCEELGVDVLITNTPAQARKTLGYS